MKKINYIVINKKSILIGLILFLILACVPLIPSLATAISPKAQYTVVIDAGHGGLDVK